MTTAIFFDDGEPIVVTESMDEVVSLIRAATNKGFSQPLLLQLTEAAEVFAPIWVNLNNVLFFREG